MKKTIPFILLSCILFMACKKTETPSYLTFKNYFTFTDSEIIVNVDETTTSFDLKAKKTSTHNNDTSQEITVDTENSTAIADVHYKIPQNMTYVFPANTTKEQSIKISLVPDNIKTELVLVMKTESDYGNVTDGKHIHKTTIRLIPVKKVI